MQFRSNKFIFPGIIVLVLLAAGLWLYDTAARKPAAPAAPVISQYMLEDQYGLRVNLVAVTALGGMVDLRFKIVDAEKAKLLLEDRANFPSLLVSDADVTLNVSEDVRSQEIQFEDDANLFLLYPNSGNAVKPGTPVNIQFGNSITLEPMAAR
jgi:hypothetical protein